MNYDNQGIINALENATNIAISGHTNPDGDAIGSCLALALCLKKMNKNPLVLLEDYNEKYNVIPGKELVFKGDLNTLSVDAFIALDCSTKERLGAAQVVFDKTDVTICIDHHMNHTPFATLNDLNEGASSASELVFKLINHLIAIDLNIATALYAGIIFDTGAFRHGSTSAETHDIASKLIALGIPFVDIHNEIMYTHSLAEAKTFAKALGNLSLENNMSIARTHISAQEMASVDAGYKDLDNVVEYALNIRGVEVSVFVYEKEVGNVKVSMRSKKADVCAIAKAFGGGGHKLASGFNFDGTIDGAFAAVLPRIKQALS